MTFVKHDNDKPDMSFLIQFSEELGQICKVLDFGAKKYSRDNWQKGSRQRYKAAALRHLITEERNDPETKLPHEVHAITNLLFDLWMHNKGVDNGRNNSEDRGGTQFDRDSEPRFTRLAGVQPHPGAVGANRRSDDYDYSQETRSTCDRVQGECGHPLGNPDPDKRREELGDCYID